MLDQLPVEIVERIVAKIPDTDLIAANVNDSYKRWIDCLTENQLYIMEKMLRNGMVVDSQERETIEYALSESRWGGDPWGLDWKWNEWTQQEVKIVLNSFTLSQFNKFWMTDLGEMTIATLWNDRKLTAFLTLCGASTFKIIQTSKGKRKLVALNTPQVFLNTNKELKWCQHSVPTLKKKHKQKAKNTPNKKSEFSEEGKEILKE
ncbi:hypothetical protein GLOIN_2v1777795 [Rhizophagus irregularis DAOM 181602=DAOM 197198]|uniref:F-box domain-containing protein n=1 Tax=Rhizophagus irregularis (strain DAOM 181602 / DAOM 197198 / MUCL 43194) TaxID=747089 RepID=A0A2P4PTW5_RHIID|nr:hypothetical protein GLOIN_2v1777795 [Rhizophagus irregularis DAOM 181602=DAOM 197198]POG68824.1 hypothetical protein GLOIN_2v1777795 [Rhizophagus irregularis DAOM 181602=DAOM 197198]|eukprot:XP_025175690.1 hypothetical protein GLOIN_2v1777795 [Rhizophagus irregularis DAOM 181602=DAOM 197198]